MGWFSGAGNGTETGHTMNVRISLSDGPASAPRSSMNDTSLSGAPMPYTTRSPALGMAIRSRSPESTSSPSSPPADRPVGRSRQHETDARMLREAHGRARMPALDLLQRHRGGIIQEID